MYAFHTAGVIFHVNKILKEFSPASRAAAVSAELPCVNSCFAINLRVLCSFNDLPHTVFSKVKYAHYILSGTLRVIAFAYP